MNYKNIFILKIIIFLINLYFFINIQIFTLFSHSGGTNSQGCHNNYSTGGYHCHSGSSSSGSYGSSGSDFSSIFVGIFRIAIIVFIISLFIPKKRSNEINIHNTSPNQKAQNQTLNTKKKLVYNISALAVLIIQVGRNSLRTKENFLNSKSVYFIHSFIKKVLDQRESTSVINLLETYIKKINNSNFKSENIKNEINKFSKYIKDNSDLKRKYKIIKLYINVVIQNNVILKSHRLILSYIVKNINISREKFLDIYIDMIPLDLLKEAIDLSIIGISSNMTNDEKKKILRTLYRKWSDLVTSDNIILRNKAENVLKIIGNLRTEI